MEPAGRHALITGGGRGIGAAIAGALTRAGARVTVAGRGEGALRAAVDEGIAEGFVTLDVCDDASVAAAVGQAVLARGQVDILVNNAGAVETAPFGRIARASWDRMLSVNLTSVFALSQAVLAAMTTAGWGRIVNVASTAGLTGYPYVAAYVAAKHGVVGLTRALAAETARSGVTVNAVCPGYTDTELLRDSIARIMAKTGRSEAEVLENFTRSNPQGRLVRPDEVAAAVVFLCGPGSEAMTGQAIAVAGGEVT